MLLSNRGYDEAWRLQYLTNLSELPDYEHGWYRNGGARGAPVDADGNPIFHQRAEKLGRRSDRRRAVAVGAAQAVENDRGRGSTKCAISLPSFCRNQFGVQTMAYYGGFFGDLDDDDTKKDESGTWALHTLADDETIARLASGIKRFKLPEEFDFIRIYQQIADDAKTGHGEDALGQLAQIFENRRQYARAAEYWRHSIKEYGPGGNNFKQQRLDQIVGNWGRFEPVMTQGAGQGATVDFRFRNGNKVSFQAHEIKIRKLLDDVKAYLKSNPRQLDSQKLNIGDLG